MQAFFLFCLKDPPTTALKTGGGALGQSALTNDASLIVGMQKGVEQRRNKSEQRLAS